MGRNVPWNGTRRRRMDGGHAAGYSSAWKNAPPPPPMVVNTTRRRRHVTRRRRYHANHSDKIWIRAPPPPPTATIVTNGPSWTASQQVCTNQAKQLCTFDQICPNGEGSTPVDGGSSIAHDWSAMLRADGVTNDWVHISGSGHSNCKPHDKYHGLPTWGLTNGNAYNNRVYCCSDDTALVDGSVRAENGATATAGVAFVPEVMFNGNWYPICGHYFWDNNDGATTVCQGLGYGGFSSGTHTKTRTTYSTDAMAVGECSAGQALTSCNHGGNGWGNLEYNGGWCKAGTQIGVTVTCN